MRITSLLFFLCLGCGSDDKGETSPSGGFPTGGGGLSTGSPTGVSTGTPTGTTTGLVTTPTTVDYCPAWPAPTGNVVTATTGDIVELQVTIDGLATGDTLELASGTWMLTTPLVITTPGITIRSATGNRADVVLDGTDTASSIFQVNASDVSLVSMTLTQALDDAVKVQPAGADISGAVLYDLEMVDNGRYGVYVDADLNTFFADNGSVSCSSITLTAAGRGDVRNGCTTGGIEAMRARGWTVQDNRVEGFWCASGSAKAGIRFWRGSRDTRIERNRVHHSRRGIVLGTGSDVLARTYGDLPCGGTVAQHHGGVVINNLVWATDAGLLGSAQGLQDGLALESACDSTVLHNTVYLDDSIPDDVVHRYPATSGIIANNLTHATIRRLDSSAATVNFNVELATNATWVHTPSGDFHIAPAATAGIDDGDPQWLTEVPVDHEGHVRNTPPDAGWDEQLAP